MANRRRVILLPLAAFVVVAACASGGAGAATAPSGQSLDRLIRSGRPVYCGGGRWRAVALTFDDGPGPYSAALVDLLRRRGARATFFVVGNRLARWEHGARLETTVGELGDHTWAHPRLPKLSHRNAIWQIERTRREIHRRTGQGVVLFRPPYGRMTPRLERFVAAKGMVDVLWNVDARDYPPGTSPASIVARVKAGLRPGAIIILHEIYPQSIEAARRLLPILRARNLRPVTLSELLERDPPSRAQLYARRGRC